MKKVLKFKVFYEPRFDEVCIFLCIHNEGEFQYDTPIDSIVVKVSPFWNSIADVERKVLKAKEKLFRKYQKNKNFRLAVSMVTELASKGEMSVQDQETVNFIEKFKNKVSEKKAKVLKFLAR